MQNRQLIKDRIKQLRSDGHSYNYISRELNIDKSYAWRVGTGKELQHPRPRLSNIPTITTEQIKTHMQSLETGVITETLVCIKLLQLGFDVWCPFIDRHRSDVGVFLGSKLVRIQVKTASYDANSRRYRATLTTKKKGRHIRYSDGEFEFFIVRCGCLDEYYIIPSQEGNLWRTVNLYPNREKLMERGYDWEQYHNAFNLLSDYLREESYPS